jgi:hypothetical protein
MITKLDKGLTPNWPAAIPDLDGDGAGEDGRRARDSLLMHRRRRWRSSQWSDFVPAFNKFAADSGQKNGVTVTVEHIPEQDIAARAASEVRRSPDTTCSCGMVPAAHISTGRTSST